MKLLFQVMILAVMLVVSGCSVHRAHRTSSARAAYGDGVPDFKAHKKKNQKRKKKARSAAKRKNVRDDNKLYFEGRPY